MRKTKEDVEDEIGDLHFFTGDDADAGELGAGREGTESDNDHLHDSRPARQRVELRNEQRSLRRQLSDWDDYADFDTDL